MKRQTYLLRKAGRYHFRRRFTFGAGNRNPITLSLGTADPVDARRIASRLAVRWDVIAMYVADGIERGTLTIEEQRTLFRRGLEEELAEATRHVTALKRPDIDEASYSKVAVAAYRIVASVPHDAPEITRAQIEPHIDDNWTAAERRLLTNMLRIHITPMRVSRRHAIHALERLGTPINDGTTAEAGWNLIRGRIEAHERAALIDHPLFADRDVPAHYLLDDELVQQARRVVPIAAPSVVSSVVEPSTPMPPSGSDNGYFARTTTIRFSEQLDELLETMVLNKNYKPDRGQRKRVLETFAWITADKALNDYGPEDRIAYVKAMKAIPNNVRFGILGKSGLMERPYAKAVFEAPTAGTQRSDRGRRS